MSVCVVGSGGVGLIIFINHPFAFNNIHHISVFLDISNLDEVIR